MKKFFVFVMALCCSAVMFAGGDIFEAWVTYSVNDDELGAHLVGKNVEEAADVNLGIVNKFYIDSFFVKVWQDNGDQFDKLYVHYRYAGGADQKVEMSFKRLLGDNDREWGGKIQLDMADPCADGDHTLEVWFSGVLNPGEQTKYMSNNSKNYKFNFTKGTPPEKVTSWAIIGSFNSWTSGFGLEADENGSLNTLIPVEAEASYEFKIIRIVAQGEKKDTTWYGLPSEGNVMRYGKCTGWVAYQSEGDKNQANVGLKTTAKGDYVFSVDPTNQADGKIAPSFSVNIPEPLPDTREKREIVFVPGGVKSNNPTMLVHAFTKGKVPFSATMTVKKEGEDTVCYVAQVPQELDSLIFVRAATEVKDWEDLNWGEGGNVWNQTEDLLIGCDTATFVDWVPETKYFKVGWCGSESKVLGDEYFIKLPSSEDPSADWVWHAMEKDVDTNLWNFDAQWQDGGADISISMEEGAVHKYFGEEAIDFGDNKVKPEVGTECTYVWNPAEQKLSVNYEKKEGIETVYQLDLTAPMYNLLGVEVDATFHGIVIQNGHKYIR